MYILGISAFYHDSAACLLKDDTIVAAAQEERFTRIKNDASFPVRSIQFCLSYAGIQLNEVDHIVFYEKPFLKFERLLETYTAFAPKGFTSFSKAIPLWIKDKLFQKRNILSHLQQIDQTWQCDSKKLFFSEHHRSHAASAFYPSPFEEAVILTVDGVGEWATTTVSYGQQNKIVTHREINFPHSVGLLYSAFTYYLGFKVNSDEYKVMGLAPYGEPVYQELIEKNLVDIKDDGSFMLNMAYFNYATGLTMTNKKFNQLFNAPPRQISAPISRFHMDIAASIQPVTEHILIKITKHIRKLYSTDNLCLAGGVALNCVANSKILQQSGFKNIWVQPAAGDAGGAIGAAFEYYYGYLQRGRTIPAHGDQMQNMLLGPCWTNEYIQRMLQQKQMIFERKEDDELNAWLATQLQVGKVIGYFKGRMEFGPRALGARSILADPRVPGMQQIINSKIKFREGFRPFAPAILNDHVGAYFSPIVYSPYMLFTAQILPEHRNCLPPAVQGFDKLKHPASVVPAITHIDYSARLQTVSPDQHPAFYQLIKAFYQLTGCPMLVNTSFNVMDEPIVCSPEDALHCFQHSGLDLLVLENFVIGRKDIPKSLC